MTPAGLAQVEAAKKDGRWDKAYDASSTMTVPEDFLKELKRDKDAYAFFKTLNRANTYAIGWRLQTAKKPEIRLLRMKKLLAMMSEGKKLRDPISSFMSIQLIELVPPPQDSNVL